MKKIIALSVVAFALSAVAASANWLNIEDNSGDDPFYAFNQSSTSFFGVNVDQDADVDLDLDIDVESGGNVIAAGEDITNGTIDVGGNDVVVQVGLDVNTADITTCGCAAGADENETNVEGNASDDGFYAGNQESNDATLVEYDSDADLDADMDVDVETGENVSAAGDDNTGSKLTIEGSKFGFTQLFFINEFTLN